MGRMRKIDSIDPIDVSRRQPTTSEQDQKPQPGYWTIADKKYCMLCIYKGTFHTGWLCNYLTIVGKSRGCKAGVGCIRRLTEKDCVPGNEFAKFSFGSGQVQKQSKPPKPKVPRYPKIDLLCQRCGATFQGTAKAKFCPECRTLKLKEGYKKWNEEQKGRRKSDE